MEPTAKVKKVNSILEKDLVRKSKHYVVTDRKEIFVESRLKENRRIIDEFWLHHCNRCCYIWISKIENPKTCSEKSCRSPYWNKDRVRVDF